MKKEYLIDQFKEFKNNNSSLSIYLVNKKNKNLHNFLKMELSDTVQENIFELTYKNLMSIVNSNELVEFDPVSKEDYTIEYLESNSIKEYSTLINNMGTTSNYVDSINSLNNKINFYITEFKNKSGNNIKIFRRYLKNKSLSKGFLGKILDKKFDKIESNIFQIDESIDFISIDDSILIIFNRYSFEVITGYTTNYMENLDKALQEIKNSNLINNIDQFCNDCKDSVKIAKKFTKAMDNNSISLILKNIDNIDIVLKEAELSIRFINNKFEYTGKEDLHELVKLLSDEYAKTIIGKRMKK